MRFGLIGAGVLALASFATPVLACVDDVPADLRPLFNDAVNFREDRDLKAAERLFKQLLPKAPESFCARYAYGRLLIQDDRLDEALGELDSAILLTESSGAFGETPYNTRGYIYLQKRAYEMAIDDFERQKKVEDFTLLPVNSRMRVFNNTGYAYLQLDRYEEAIREFNQAEALGSILAKRNLTVVNSILRTVKAGDVDIPGIFASVVISTRSREDLNGRLGRLAKQLAISRNELHVFERGDGMLHITYGAFLSYPKAEKLRDHAQQNGITDAFIASVSDWSEVFIEQKPE